MTAARTMRALQLRALGHLDEVELPVPRPKPDEVLIETVATTICTSDLHDISRNPFGIGLPRVLGHEGAGTVAALGEEVAGLSIGQRVAAHPVIPCGRCDSCRRGLGHLCDDMGHLGLDRDGTFAQYFCAPASRVRALPEGLDAALGALAEPVAVCLEAVRRARISPGDNLLIVGDGPFGIIIGRLALRSAPARVVFVGRHEFRLSQVPEAARINERRTNRVEAAVREASGGQGVDAAILAVASGEGFQLCVRSLRSRGRVVLFSGVEQPEAVSLLPVHAKELEILGACNDQGYLDEALSSLSDSDLRLDSLITHRVPFANWREAFALASGRKDEALKVAIIFDEAVI